MANGELTYEEFKEMDEETRMYHIFIRMGEIMRVLSDHKDTTDRKVDDHEKRIIKLENSRKMNWFHIVFALIIGGVIVAAGLNIVDFVLRLL